jgi:hypothetical protein
MLTGGKMPKRKKEKIKLTEAEKRKLIWEHKNRRENYGSIK